MARSHGATNRHGVSSVAVGAWRRLIALVMIGACGGPSLPELTLSEVARLPLPDSVSLAGASPSARGAVIAWVRNPGGVLLFDEVGRQQVVPNVSFGEPVGAGFAAGDSVFEVVDSRIASVIRIDTGNRQIRQRRFNVDVVVSAAALHRTGIWYLGGVDGDGGFRVYELAPDRSDATLLATVEPLPGIRLTRPYASLSLSGDGVVLSFLDRPFSIFVIGDAGPVVEWPKPSRFHTRRHADPDAEWLALGVWPLDSGYVRTLSDLRSDTREMQLYNRAGILVRRRDFSTALAIIASRPEDRLLLAAHRVDRDYIVLYRWEWMTRANRQAAAAETRPR